MHNVCPVAGLERMTSGSVGKRLTISRHTSIVNATLSDEFVSDFHVTKVLLLFYRV